MGTLPDQHDAEAKVMDYSIGEDSARFVFYRKTVDLNGGFAVVKWFLLVFLGLMILLAFCLRKEEALVALAGIGGIGIMVLLAMFLKSDSRDLWETPTEIRADREHLWIETVADNQVQQIKLQAKDIRGFEIINRQHVYRLSAYGEELNCLFWVEFTTREEIDLLKINRSIRRALGIRKKNREDSSEAETGKKSE